MIPKFSDHAANERTFLAWVRTGIATIAFGFVIEKFNLFLSTFVRAEVSSGRIPDASVNVYNAAHNTLGRYDGTALVFAGILLIAVAAWRFVRTSRLIESEEAHPLTSIRTELVLTLVLIAAALTAYVAFY
ncbi:MAG TPA: DUF202 domain-containing protein [Nitrobacter sp.]|jgi:putative membrane protein|nr:DUF202 domain-containing protein [Nitrobacter sp.]